MPISQQRITNAGFFSNKTMPITSFFSNALLFLNNAQFFLLSLRNKVN